MTRQILKVRLRYGHRRKVVQPTSRRHRLLEDLNSRGLCGVREDRTSRGGSFGAACSVGAAAALFVIVVAVLVGA